MSLEAVLAALRRHARVCALCSPNSPCLAKLHLIEAAEYWEGSKA
jgi:hypothetical protein